MRTSIKDFGSRQHGITLVELMVALAIGSFLMIGAYLWMTSEIVMGRSPTMGRAIVMGFKKLFPVMLISLLIDE